MLSPILGRGVDMPHLERLSTRQREVLALVSDGYTDREIAALLVLSVRTVHGHVGRLLATLGVSNRREAGRVYRTESTETGTKYAS